MPFCSNESRESLGETIDGVMVGPYLKTLELQTKTPFLLLNTLFDTDPYFEVNFYDAMHTNNKLQY